MLEARPILIRSYHFIVFRDHAIASRRVIPAAMQLDQRHAVMHR